MSTVRLLCAQLRTFQSQPKCSNLSPVQIPMGKNLSQEIFTVYFKWLLVRFHQNVELAIGYKSTPPRRHSPPHAFLAFLSNQSSRHLFFKIIIIIITVSTYILVPPHRHDTKVPGTPPKRDGSGEYDYDDDIEDDHKYESGEDENPNLSLRRWCEVAGEKCSMSSHTNNVFCFKCWKFWMIIIMSFFSQFPRKKYFLLCWTCLCKFLSNWLIANFPGSCNWIISKKGNGWNTAFTIVLLHKITKKFST